MKIVSEVFITLRCARVVAGKSSQNHQITERSSGGYQRSGRGKGGSHRLLCNKLQYNTENNSLLPIKTSKIHRLIFSLYQ